jgi:predicted nuclease of predicted toxin-antitoxin system
MRVLLDENMPLDFGALLRGHETRHLEELGMKGTKNGAMLAYARETFDALVTLDRGILFQHHHGGSNLIVVVVRVINSKPETVKAKASTVLAAIESAEPGTLLQV